MQEVRKVMNQEKDIEEKTQEVWVRLCLVEAANAIAPIYLPGSSFARVGDMVLFDYNGESFQSIILMENDVRINDKCWTKTMETVGMAPIKAKGYAHIVECEWEEESK